MDEILVEFRNESKGFVRDMTAILEEIEADSAELKRLEDVGILADRIMGTAKSLVAQDPAYQNLQPIGSYGELCKLVAYKGSQLKDKPQLAATTVALLLDASEMLDTMLDSLEPESRIDVNAVLSATFLDRLKWLSKQFDENLRGTVAVQGAQMAQAQIDALLKKLGAG